jgi:glycosyltransferase involved in cell wall biosynthesis
MKRVLHITFDMHIGGTEQVIKNLIEGTDLNHYKPSILCLEAPIGPFGELLLRKGINIDIIQRKEGFDLRLIVKVRRYIKEKRIDILHCHQYTPWVYSALAAFLTEKKVIFTEHGRFYPDRSSWKRAIINPVLNWITNQVTAISKATKQALVDYEYIPASKIQVIYNGIIPLKPVKSRSAGIRRELGISEHIRIVGTIARLDPIKNHAMMLRAFKIVTESYPDIKLLIVGDGDEMEHLKRLCQDLGIADHVILTGYITEPVCTLDLMDVFLLSSLSEGTSMTLLEAMSLAKPCVVTDTGGNPEIIEHNVNGIVTPNDDAPAFADAIIELLIDNKKYQKMSDASLDRFNRKFNLHYMVNKYQDIYEKL